MARELQTVLPSFQPKKQLLGCIAHVINLGAKAGLAVLGSLEDEDSHSISMTDMDHTASAMSILNLTSEPDGCGLDLKTVLKKINGLCIFVRVCQLATILEPTNKSNRKTYKKN